MKKKITHSVLFVAVLAGTTALTLFAGRGNLSSTIYNFVFLAVIAVLYLIAMFGGMFRMNNLSTAFHRAVEELNGMFKTPGKTDPRNLTYLGELFDDKYLDPVSYTHLDVYKRQAVCACHRKVRLFVHREAFTDYGVNSNCCCERKEQ